MGPPGRRVIVDAFGETPMDAVAHHLRIEPQPAPEPATLGPRDVVIAVKRAAVGWVDLLMTSGQYQHMPSPPYTPGLEYSGVVAWTGSDVHGLAVGDRVIADGLRTGPRSLGAYQRWGGFASWAVAPDNAVLPLPEPLSLDQGCGLLSSYETAWHCLVARGRLQAGETVLVLGASGATGLAAVHVAKILGATVIAAGRSPEKLAAVKAQGADHVVRTAALRDEVKALTGGEGVDVVYDGVGGETSRKALRCVRFGARFLLVGWASTPFVARGRGQRGAPNANLLPTNLVLIKGLDVLGCPTAITTHRDPSVRVERLAQVLDWVRRGLVVPHVGATFAFGDVREAMRAKWESRVVGGCVLRVASA